MPSPEQGMRKYTVQAGISRFPGLPVKHCRFDFHNTLMEISDKNLPILRELFKIRSSLQSRCSTNNLVQSTLEAKQPMTCFTHT